MTAALNTKHIGDSVVGQAQNLIIESEIALELRCCKSLGVRHQLNRESGGSVDWLRDDLARNLTFGMSDGEAQIDDQLIASAGDPCVRVVREGRSLGYRSSERNK